MRKDKLKSLEKIVAEQKRQQAYREDPRVGINYGDGIRFVGDDAQELREIWRSMGIEEGSEAWQWRVQTYITDKGL